MKSQQGRSKSDSARVLSGGGRERHVGGSRSNGSRPGPRWGKVDPTRMKGAWVVSDDTRTALETCELFRDISTEQLMEVAALVEEQAVPSDGLLLVEGAPATHLFVVVHGYGVAQLELDSGVVSLGSVRSGEVAGWSSLIDDQVYPASVKALTDLRVARIESKGLALLMRLEPEIGYPVHRRLSSIFYRQYESALRALKASV